jgi:hypothetical protein
MMNDTATLLDPITKFPKRASIYVQLAAADASFATGSIYGSAGGKGQP